MIRVALACVAALALLGTSASAKSPRVHVAKVSVDNGGYVSAHAIATMPVTHFVSNRGRHRSSRRTVTFSLGGVKVGTARVPAIAPRSTKKLKTVLTIPATPPGTLRLRACISGRCRSAPVTVTAAAPAIAPSSPATEPVSFLYFPADVVAFGGWNSTSAHEDLYLVNRSATDASGPVSVYTQTDSGPGHFDIVSTSCTGSLAPGAACFARVSFTPVSGATTGRLIATASPGTATTAQVALSGQWACTNPSLSPRGC